MNFNTEIKNGVHQEWSELDEGSTYRGGLDTGRDTSRDNKSSGNLIHHYVNMIFNRMPGVPIQN
jgi:hypothetical protein